MKSIWAQFIAAAFVCSAAIPAMANDVFFHSRRTAETTVNTEVSGSSDVKLTITAPSRGASSSAAGSAATKDACETGESGVLEQFVESQALGGKFCSVAKLCVNCCGPDSRFDKYRATCGSVGGNFGSTTQSDTVCEGDGGSNYLNEWLERAKAAGKSNCSTTKTCGNCCGDGNRLDSFFAFCT